MTDKPDARIRALGQRATTEILKEKPPTATQQLAGKLPWLKWPTDVKEIEAIAKACGKAARLERTTLRTKQFFIDTRAYALALAEIQAKKKP